MKTALLKLAVVKGRGYLLIGALLFMGGITVGDLFDLSIIDLKQDAPPATLPERQSPKNIDVVVQNLDSANYIPTNDTPSGSSLPEKSDEESDVDIKEVRIERGQGMMDILIKSGAERTDAYNAIQSLSKYYDMRKLQIGQKLQAVYDNKGRLNGLYMQKDFDHIIRVNRTSEDFNAVLEELPSLTMTRHVQGVINDSLFLSAYKEGLPNSIIAKMIRIFSFDVDFQREIRTGDKFEIFYERKISEDGKRVEEGNILFAKLTLRGKPISLYRYQAKNEPFANYFHKNGKSAKKALMKTPIEGARLSSLFGLRKHPVLGYTRMHKGLDFSAPTGTPIMAAGDGVVERASRYGSYGNYVRIRHNNTYKTAYAHLSKYGRGIKAGTRVKQGQIIGYVGATGRVTGRHLHYEVLVNNKQVNPLHLKIPTGITLTSKDKTKFLTLASDIDRQITLQKQNIMLSWNQDVALNDTKATEIPLLLSVH